MAEIRFPKIEVEPADLERLENIVKRFEDAIRVIDGDKIPDAIVQTTDIIARQERQIRHLRQKYIKLLGFCHDWNIAYDKLYNELVSEDYDNG